MHVFKRKPKCAAPECSKKEATKTKLGWLCIVHKKFYAADIAKLK